MNKLTVALMAGGIVAGFAAYGSAATPTEVIAAGLKDADREVRSLAAQYAGEVRMIDVEADVQKLLSDTSDTVRVKAAVALAKMADRAGVPEVKKILATRPKLSDNPKPLERARAIARGSVRAEAALALGEMKDQGSLQLLQKMTDDDDGRVADAAYISLGRLGIASAKNQFMSALESTKQEVRAKAAQALGDIGDPGAIVPLRKRLKDWDRGAKSAAVIALAKLGDRESAPAIREMLWDEDEIIRENAATALGMIGSSTTVASLEELVRKDKNGMVRIAGADSLRKLNSDSGKEFLLEAVKSDDKDARVRALNALQGMVTDKDIPALTPLLENADRTVAVTAAKVLYASQSKKKQY